MARPQGRSPAGSVAEREDRPLLFGSVFKGTPNVVYFLIFLQNIKNCCSGLFQIDNVSDSLEFYIDLRHCKDIFYSAFKNN